MPRLERITPGQQRAGAQKARRLDRTQPGSVRNIKPALPPAPPSVRRALDRGVIRTPAERHEAIKYVHQVNNVIRAENRSAHHLFLWHTQRNRALLRAQGADIPSQSGLGAGGGAFPTPVVHPRPRPDMSFGPVIGRALRDSFLSPARYVGRVLDFRPTKYAGTGAWRGPSRFRYDPTVADIAGTAALAVPVAGLGIKTALTARSLYRLGQVVRAEGSGGRIALEALRAAPKVVPRALPKIALAGAAKSFRLGIRAPIAAELLPGGHIERAFQGTGRFASILPTGTAQGPIGTVKNLIHDAFNLPANALPMIYLPTAAFVHGEVTHDWAPLKALWETARTTDAGIMATDSLLAQIGLGHSHSWKDIRHAIQQHPGFFLAELGAIHAGIGRGIGGTARAFTPKGHLPKVLRQGLGSREPVPFTNGRGQYPRELSPNVITAVAQQLRDRITTPARQRQGFRGRKGDVLRRRTGVHVQQAKNVAWQRDQSDRIAHLAKAMELPHADITPVIQWVAQGQLSRDTLIPDLDREIARIEGSIASDLQSRPASRARAETNLAALRKVRENPDLYWPELAKASDAYAQMIGPLEALTQRLDLAHPDMHARAAAKPALITREVGRWVSKREIAGRLRERVTAAKQERQRTETQARRAQQEVADARVAVARLRSPAPWKAKERPRIGGQPKGVKTLTPNQGDALLGAEARLRAAQKGRRDAVGELRVAKKEEKLLNTERVKGGRLEAFIPEQAGAIVYRNDETALTLDELRPSKTGSAGPGWYFATDRLPADRTGYGTHTMVARITPDADIRHIPKTNNPGAVRAAAERAAAEGADGVSYDASGRRLVVLFNHEKLQPVASDYGVPDLAKGAVRHTTGRAMTMKEIAQALKSADVQPLYMSERTYEAPGGVTRSSGTPNRPEGGTKTGRTTLEGTTNATLRNFLANPQRRIRFLGNFQMAQRALAILTSKERFHSDVVAAEHAGDNQVPINVEAYTKRATIQEAMREGSPEAYDPEVIEYLTREETKIAEELRKPGLGEWRLIDRKDLDLLQKSLSAKDDYPNLTAMNAAWKRVILTTTPTWYSGNFMNVTMIGLLKGLAPPPFSALALKAGIGAGARGRRFLANLDEFDRGAFGAGGLVETSLRRGVHEPIGERVGTRDVRPDINFFFRGLSRLGRKQGVKQTIDTWSAVSSAAMAINAKIVEEPIFSQVLGRELTNHIRRNLPLWRRYQAVTKQALIDLAAGYHESGAQMALADIINKETGNWHILEPWERRWKNNWVPFILWYKAASRFVLMTMPHDHPIVTGIIGAAATMTDEERKRLGLDMFAANHQPMHLMGSIPAAGRLRKTSNLTAFGLFSDYPGVAANAMLPPVAGGIKALGGVSWTGAQYQDANGQGLDAPARIALGLYLTVEGFLPFASIASKIVARGRVAPIPFFQHRGNKQWGWGGSVKRALLPAPFPGSRTYAQEQVGSGGGRPKSRKAPGSALGGGGGGGRGSALGGGSGGGRGSALGGAAGG